MFHLIILPAIFWQSLFLLIATAWDTFLFYRQLRVSRRIAIEYARTLNLFTLVLSWIFFFLISPFLSQATELRMISLLFFSRPFNIQAGELQITFLWYLVVIIVVTTVIKFAGMRVLQSLLQNFSPAGQNITHNKIDRKPLFTFTSELSIIFLSNIMINITIALLLVARVIYS
jgi:hypothetical protein